MNQEKRAWVWPLCFALVIIGLALSGYLNYRTLALEGEAAASPFDVCSALFRGSCDDTLQSETSWFLGMPVAGWGIVYFATFASLLILGRSLKAAFMPQAAVAMVLLDVAGIGVGAVLFSQFLRGAPFCPLCAGVHLVLLALLPSVGLLYGQSIRAFYRDLQGVIAYVFGKDSEDPTGATWRVVGLVTAALVGVVVFQWLLLMTNEARYAGTEEVDWRRILAEFRETLPVDLSVDSSDPRIGPATAPIQIVIFSSLQCPGCQVLARNLVDLPDRYEDEVSQIFKHFPLSSECNAAIERDMHPKACNLAAATIAAFNQGKFWAFHDALFDRDLNPSDARIQQIAQEIGLELERFATDRESAETVQKLQRDIELGIRLNINQTPTVFINGKRVSPDALNMLDLLVGHALSDVPDR